MKFFLPIFTLFSSATSFNVNAPRTAAKSQLSASTSTIDELKTQIENEISGTSRGLSVSGAQEESINTLIEELESACPLAEPARSPLMGGKWIVDYTTSPPPSNGKLGPFVGFARQIIDLDKGTYVNYLSVPGDIEKEWLSAKLEATFSEWDGTLLKDDRIKEDKDAIVDGDEENKDESATENKAEETQAPPKQDFFASLQSMFSGNGNSSSKPVKPETPDYGADSWLVNFDTLTIRAFGIPLITKKFDNVSRIWKMSYLDDETRVGK
jgi:hypothetical protein